MPELPELQAHAERLTKGWGGNVLRKFTPLSFTAMKTAVPPRRPTRSTTRSKVSAAAASTCCSTSARSRSPCT